MTPAQRNQSTYDTGIQLTFRCESTPQTASSLSDLHQCPDRPVRPCALEPRNSRPTKVCPRDYNIAVTVGRRAHNHYLCTSVTLPTQKRELKLACSIHADRAQPHHERPYERRATCSYSVPSSVRPVCTQFTIRRESHEFFVSGYQCNLETCPPTVLHK